MTLYVKYPATFLFVLQWVKNTRNVLYDTPNLKEKEKTLFYKEYKVRNIFLTETRNSGNNFKSHSKYEIYKLNKMDINIYKWLSTFSGLCIILIILVSYGCMNMCDQKLIKVEV